MQIRIKDVANLSSDFEDGRYESEIVPRVGETITYQGNKMVHYKVVGVWHNGNKHDAAMNVFLFCEKLDKSPFEAFKKAYESNSEDIRR